MWRFAAMRPSRALHALPAFVGTATVTTKDRWASCENVLHQRSEHLQTRGRTSNPKAPRTKISRKASSQDTVHVVRIALTGGPCAGKSSALEYIVAAGKKEGFDVYCAPETATLLFNSGVTTDIFATPQGSFEFQVALARMQLQMERGLVQIAARTGRPSIIIFDRGLLDAKGYVDTATWEQVLANIVASDSRLNSGVSEEYLLARYDCVVHLVTAADGAEKFYKWGKTTDDSGNVVIRGEPPEQARALDRKMQQVWSGHPEHVIVGNLGTFKEKLETVRDAVLRAARNKH